VQELNELNRIQMTDDCCSVSSDGSSEVSTYSNNEDIVNNLSGGDAAMSSSSSGSQKRKTSDYHINKSKKVRSIIECQTKQNVKNGGQQMISNAEKNDKEDYIEMTSDTNEETDT
jgi:hypothetical protein